MPHHSSKKPTIRDVARQADVSIGTVSNALNRPESIHPDTLARVRKAIAHLDFQPSPGARSRRRKPVAANKSSSEDGIGILLLGERNLHWIMKEAPIYAYALHGAEQEATRQGRPCQVLHAKNVEALHTLRHNFPVGGLILLTADHTPLFPSDFSLPPIVKIMGLPNTRWGDCCTYSSYGTGRTAAEYLHSRGCTRIGCLSNDQRGVPAVRTQGFDDALSDLGIATSIKPPRNPFGGWHQPDDAAILADLKTLFKKPKPIDGLFITADILAPSTYRALNQLKIKPGTDVAVVTCNNERPYLMDLDPAPAVIDIHAEFIGAEAVKLLDWRRSAPDEPRRTIMIEPTLIPQPPI
jgi:DNA-binding LacI/PurR family transcriptional regulator